MTVHLLGYEERETVWRTDLIKSQGQAARVAQLAAVSAAENALESAQVQDESQTKCGKDNASKTEEPTIVEQSKVINMGGIWVKNVPQVIFF